MKKNFLVILLLSVFGANAQRTNRELERDSVLRWAYFNAALKPQAYKPVKDKLSGFTYSVWQQQIADTLLKWVQQSYLPRGLMIRLRKGEARYSVGGSPVLHSYGVNFYSYVSAFYDGKVDLGGEFGYAMGLNINEFPGKYIEGFNPAGMHLFLEKARFSTGDNEKELKEDGIEPGLHPRFSAYRTYLNHFHSGGKAYTQTSFILSPDNEWPFKQLTVGELLDLLEKQLATYPAFDQKTYFNVFRDHLKAQKERLKPHLNEIAVVKDGLIASGNDYIDEEGHKIIDPGYILNPYQPTGSFPEYFHVVTPKRAVLEQAKTDKPLWVHMQLPDIIGKPFDSSMRSGRQFMAYSLLRNFNFDYVYNYFFAPERVRGTAYKPLNEPLKSIPSAAPPAFLSETAIARQNEPATILYEDFAGYPNGAAAQQGWHTDFGQAGVYPVATVHSIGGQEGKWIDIPRHTTLYPDYKKKLPENFSISYDVFFSKAKSYRAPFTFAIVTDRQKIKQPLDISYSVINRYETNIQFHIALDSYGENYETTYSKRADDIETSQRAITGPATPDTAARVVITVKGTAVTITINGKEVMNDAGYLPPGTKFEKYGWANLDGVPGIYLSNVYIKSL